MVLVIFIPYSNNGTYEGSFFAFLAGVGSKYVAGMCVTNVTTNESANLRRTTAK